MTDSENSILYMEIYQINQAWKVQ